MTDESAAPRSVLATVEDEVLHLIDLAIEEDRGTGDWTSRWIVPARLRVRARVLAGATGVIAGLTPSMAGSRPIAWSRKANRSKQARSSTR